MDMNDDRLTLEAALDIPLEDEPEPKAAAGEPEEGDDEEIQDAAPTADEEAEALDEVTDADDDEAVEDEDAEDAPETVSVVAPPKSWGDEEAKAVWSKLPPEVQRQVATREEQRDQATQRILSESGQARKQAVEATQVLGQYTQRAAAALEQIESAFTQQGYDKMTKADWARLAQSDPNAYNQHRAYAEYLSEQHQEAQRVRANAQLAQQKAFAEQQRELLKTHAPEVLQAIPEVTQYACQRFGYEPSQIDDGSAADIIMAWESLQYQKMTQQAKQKAASSKPQAKPAPKALSASAGQTSTPTARKKATAYKAFAAKPSIENAIHLLPDV